MSLQPPLIGTPAWLFGVFTIGLVVFHMLFVWKYPFSKRRWKQVDYAWISIAVIGLYGSAGGVRRAFGTQLTELSMSRLEERYDLLREQVKSLSSTAVCRTRARAEDSPPNRDEVQEEFNAVCLYGQKVLERLPHHAPLTTKDLASLSLQDRPAVANPMLQEIYGKLDRELATFTTYFKDYERSHAASDFSKFDLMFMAFSPNLLAIALALRMTKVTGEMRLEKSAAPSGSKVATSGANGSQPAAAPVERNETRSPEQRANS